MLKRESAVAMPLRLTGALLVAHFPQQPRPSHRPFPFHGGRPADLSGATSYNNTTTFYSVYSDYVIPVAQAASCNGVWDYSSSWVGIYGSGSADVLQAGTEADAYCSGSTKSTFYTPGDSAAYLVNMSVALSYPSVIGPQAIWFYQ
jgi:hypothetical protein